MTKLKIVNMIASSGAALLVVTVLWWAVTYNQVTNRLDNAIHNLESANNGCAIANTVVQIGGQMPYESAVVWVALLVLAIGLGMRVDVTGI